MSGAVRQGRLAVDWTALARDPWTVGTTPDPETPMSSTAKAAIAQARADVSAALSRRFGPGNDIAQMLGLDDPVTEALRDITAASYDLNVRLGRLLGRVS